MKTILVPVEQNDLIESVLDSAFLLGRSFGSYIEGFALGPQLGPFVTPDSVGGTIVYDADVLLDAAAISEARRVFEAGMAARIREAGEAGVTVGWLDDQSRSDAFVGSYGRVFEITVVGRPDGAATSPRMATLEAALFESGRPVLIAPPDRPKSLGTVAAIAWNRSAETARTVAFSLPLLRKAKKVTVLSVEGGSTIGPPGEELVRYLARNAVVADLIPIVKSGSRSVGPAIMEQSVAIGADLLVKGAFTQSRVSQMIFGGATRDILSGATMPVFMAH